MKVCCFSGHRPGRFPWGDDENDEECRRLKVLLRDEIERAFCDGYAYFIAGGALGVDTWAAELVRELKHKSKATVTLEIALPFEGYNQRAGRNKGSRFAKIRGAADRVTVVSNMKSILAFYERNRYMVDKSQRLIAVFDERSGIRGGTYHTINYARKKGIEVRQIGWMG